MNIKRILSLLTVLVLFSLVTAMPVFAETVAGGTCGEGGGDNLTWVLDSGGVLTVSGTGAMGDFAEAPYAPWYSANESIQKVVICDGVTFIGRRAFCDCTHLTDLVLPESIIIIDNSAFLNCPNLENVYYCSDFSAWNNVQILPGNDCLKDAAMHYDYLFSDTPACSEALMRVQKEGGGYRCDFEIQLLGITQPCTLIAALYDGDVFVDAVAAALSPGDTTAAPSLYSETAVTSARVYLWGDWNGMQPLCEKTVLK